MKDESFEKRILTQFRSNPLKISPLPKTKIFSERHIPSLLSKTTSDSVDWFSTQDKKISSEEESAEYSDKKTFKQLLSNQSLTPQKSNYFSFQTSQNNTKNKYFSWRRSALSQENQKILDHILIQPRKIPKAPYKTLEAPDLKDDFYFNLLDWSPFGNLAVALGKVVYIWNSRTSSVLRLCETEDTITSLSCSPLDNTLAVATDKGQVVIYSIEDSSEILSFRPHVARIGAMTWNDHILACGSRDKKITQTDLRSLGSRDLCLQTSATFRGHSQEVCGLRFSPDGRFLASGGNDNKLILWDVLSSSRKPAYTFFEHKAAVKALAWSPHKRGLLASGGGSADQEIRFWNSLTGQSLSHYKTESQICNLLWSKNTNELVSTHGYSLNEVIVWKYPLMTQLARLSGHMARVLYVALSPDGSTVVTGSGDESLRFWNLFDATCTKRKRSVLALDNFVR